MDDGSLAQAIERGERALARIERALEARGKRGAPDEALRARVREAVAELDQLIREAAP